MRSVQTRGAVRSAQRGGSARFTRFGTYIAMWTAGPGFGGERAFRPAAAPEQLRAAAERRLGNVHPSMPRGLSRTGTTMVQVTHNPECAARGNRRFELFDGWLKAAV